MKASGATSITPRSRCWETLSGSSMSCSASNSGRRYGSTFAIRSPGRKPSRSPASTAGRVRMIRLTSRRLSAAAAMRHRQEGLAGAGRADPEGDRVVADRVDVALLVDGLGRDPRRAVAPDDVLEDLAPATRARPARAITASTVPGAISWPWRTSSASSRTTAAPASTAAWSPSSVSTLPRRNTSQSRCPSSVRRMLSSVPASSAATVVVQFELRLGITLARSPSALRLIRPAPPAPAPTPACPRRGRPTRP